MLNIKKIFLVASVLLLLCGCLKKQEKTAEKPNIVTTTNLIADIVKNIGGEFVEVYPLMAPGVDPHLYKASEGDIIRLSNADLILHNGLNLEGKLGEVLSRVNSKIPSYAVTSEIPKENIFYHDSEPDPHVWFDPALWVFAVNSVADSLVNLDPSNAVYYRKNEEKYVQQLLVLNSEVRQKLDSVPPKKRVLITSHDAFSYFGKAYGWEVVGIQGINTASETSVHNLQSLASLIVDKDITCVFTETSVSPRSIEALAEAVSARGKQLRIGFPLYSDSLGEPGTEAENYIDMVKTNVNNIVSGIMNE